MKKLLLYFVVIIVVMLPLLISGAGVASAATVTVSPNGQGGYTNIPYQNNGCDDCSSVAKHWQCVKQNSVACYVRAPGSGSDVDYRDAYTLGDVSGYSGTINSVTVYANINPKGWSRYELGIGLGASESVSSPVCVPASCTSNFDWNLVSQTISRPGGGSWSWTDINDMYVILGLRRKSTTSGMYCEWVYVVISYTPGLAGVATVDEIDNSLIGKLEDIAVGGIKSVDGVQ